MHNHRQREVARIENKMKVSRTQRRETVHGRLCLSGMGLNTDSGCGLTPRVTDMLECFVTSQRALKLTTGMLENLDASHKTTTQTDNDIYLIGVMDLELHITFVEWISYLMLIRNLEDECDLVLIVFFFFHGKQHVTRLNVPKIHTECCLWYRVCFNQQGIT